MKHLPGDDVTWNKQRVRVVDQTDPKLVNHNQEPPTYNSKPLVLVVATNGQLVYVREEDISV